MSGLGAMTCQACRAGAPLVSQDEIATYMSQLTGWEIVVADGINHLEKTYKFKNFDHSLQFTNMVGAIAEAEKHHPAILTEWGKVTVTWWTHKIAGLHANDFIMAAKTDGIGCSSSNLI